jgi:hypothetical protein
VSVVLQKAYPDYDWKPWLFKRSPVHFWNDVANQRKFFDHVAAELKMNGLNDWYKVSISDFRARGGSGVLAVNGGSLIRGCVYIMLLYR